MLTSASYSALYVSEGLGSKGPTIWSDLSNGHTLNSPIVSYRMTDGVT